MQATQTAVRNHHEEKLRVLRNFVLNAATSQTKSEDMQLLFLNWIDEFTPMHFKILKFYVYPPRSMKKEDISLKDWDKKTPYDLLEHVFPDLKSKRFVFIQIVKDLYSRDLIEINTKSLFAKTKARELFLPYITRLGQTFLHFVTSPIEEEKELD